VAAIILWNTVYLERAINHLNSQGLQIDETLLKHLSPLGWEHINLTGDYIWHQDKKDELGKSRPLRPIQFLSVRFFSFRDVAPNESSVNSKTIAF
jgi:hypothetical protein